MSSNCHAAARIGGVSQGGVLNLQVPGAGGESSVHRFAMRMKALYCCQFASVILVPAGMSLTSYEPGEAGVVIRSG